ncbi:MAG: hypothetical protein N3C13_00865 [Aquificaceae bacterium]|nr:hypothetical protein [Aquificaceae bacterium]MCX8059733.1 hypothetical protein [Aquificaceae bacterium]MDW8096932.1 hypothetical protein [Aquificaceae bacterium]
MQNWKPVVRDKFFLDRELVIYVVLFFGVCLLLFPRGRLEKYVLAPERANVELSILYVRNLLKIQEDPLLRLHLVDSLVQGGYVQEAEREARSLLNTPYADRAYLALFRAQKHKYFAGQNKSTELMQEYLLAALKLTQDRALILEIKKSATEMNLPFVVMQSAEKLYRLEEKLEWLREAYRYATALQETKYAILYASELSKREPARKDKYIKDITYLLGKDEKREENLQYLRRAFGEAVYAQVLSGLSAPQPTADGVVLQAPPVELSTLLEEQKRLFVNSRSYAQRKALFKKILELYFARQDYEGARAFMLSHYREFAKDTDMALYVLKSAHATGDPRLAWEVAKELKEVHLR